MDAEALNDWFEREVMPLEGLLEGYLRRNWRDRDEVPDLRQEVYARVYDSAARGLPESTQAFVLSTARNLLVDRARRARIVSIETFADLDALAPSRDELSPERHLAARSELRLLQAALDLLPALCREVVALRKIEDVPQREVARRLGIKEEAVERLVAKGVRALGEALRAGLQGRRAEPGKSDGTGASEAPAQQGRSTP